MAAAILEIPPPSIRPRPGFPESKRHSAKIRPPKAPPPLPLQTTSYVDDISVSLLGKDILINTINMALIAENLIHRASSLNLSFSLEKTDLIHFFNPKNSTKPKDISQIKFSGFPRRSSIKERRHAFRPVLVSLFPFYEYPSVKCATQSYSNVPVSKTTSPILSSVSPSCVSLISISSRIFRYPNPVAFKKATTFPIVLGPIMLWQRLVLISSPVSDVMAALSTASSVQCIKR
jgi:hypothetical protein